MLALFVFLKYLLTILCKQTNKQIDKQGLHLHRTPSSAFADKPEGKPVWGPREESAWEGNGQANFDKQNMTQKTQRRAE